MGDEERRRFMMEGTRTGKVATVRPDASPHVTPIWFVLDGDDVVLMTGSRRSPTCGWTARPS